ncbi:MAG: DUF4331 family protein [Gemmatimonadaceae bacterium]
MLRNTAGATRRVALGLAIGAGALTLTTVIWASDHQDTPEVEIQQLPDINDVFAFPGSSTDRIVLAVTTASPITPAQSATIGFDPNLLYQIKIDRTGDAIEDLVMQLRFTAKGPQQRVKLYGPVAPTSTGGINSLATETPTLEGPVNTALGNPTGIQLQAGLFNDPFVIDLAQFFRILPDRRPARGPLSKIHDPASSFRNPGIDFLRGFNALGIVIELPESMLLPPGAGTDPVIGVWATTSR